MKITKEGFAVLERDSHLSGWIEESGRIDHNENVDATVCKYFNAGDWVVDIGASLGDHTVPYAAKVGPGGKVMAFEPQPESYECLVYNTKNYPWVRTYNVALGEREDEGILDRCENIGASRLHTEPFEGDCNNVPIRTLDSFRFKRVDFIKIDTEGWDLFVMRGAGETIMRHRPKILFELSGCSWKYFGLRTKDFTDFIDKIGYTASPAIDLKDGIMIDTLLTPL